MRIAIYGDIHGNLPPLNAVLADIDKHRPDATRAHTTPETKAR
jgi:hypothetical protein